MGFAPKQRAEKNRASVDDTLHQGLHCSDFGPILGLARKTTMTMVSVRVGFRNAVVEELDFALDSGMLTLQMTLKIHVRAEKYLT